MSTASIVRDLPSSIERVDVSAKDFQVRTFAERFVGPVRVEIGLDINGRYGLQAVDVTNTGS